MATTTAVAPTPERLPLQLDAVPAAAPRRPRVLLIGATFAATASVAFMGALLAVYFALRSEHVAAGETWLPEGASIPLAPGNVTMITLLMSLVTVQWAIHAGKLRDRGHAYLALGLTLLFGVAHIVQLSFLFSEWNLPLNEEPTMQAVLIFTIMGAHLAMVVGSLVFLFLMFLRSLGGQLAGRDVEGLSAAALYWYVTVALFAVIWYGILIVK